MSDQNFEITVAADPTWEPLEFGDTLDTDGAFMGEIIGEKVSLNDGQGKKAGIWLTVQILDTDHAGKKIQKFLQDPRENEKVMFLWRGMMRSIVGIEQARAGFAYRPGMLRGQRCYFRVDSYTSNDGERRSGMGNWLTKSEYDDYVAKGRHRWAPAVAARPAAPTPMGLPTSFPGLPTTPQGPPQPPAAFPVAAPVAPPVAPQPPANPFTAAAPQVLAQTPPAPPANPFAAAAAGNSVPAPTPPANPFAFPPAK